MTFTKPYVAFWTRIKKGFLAGFVMVSLIILFSSVKEKGDFEIVGLMILVVGVYFMVTAVVNACTYVFEVKFIDEKMIVTGATLDTRWIKEFVIKDTDIKIKSKGRGRGHVEYFLRLSSVDQCVDINRSFNWDYPSLVLIFDEFKRIKGKKIIFDEKYFVDIMKTKKMIV